MRLATVNPGEDVSAAVANAPGGSTVCRNSVNHKTLILKEVAKNPRVMVQSASGRGAKLAFEMRDGTSGITLDNLTLASGYIYGKTPHDITISHSDFVENARMVIDGAVRSSILLDGNTHNNNNPPPNSFQGRVELPDHPNLKCTPPSNPSHSSRMRSWIARAAAGSCSTYLAAPEQP